MSASGVPLSTLLKQKNVEGEGDEPKKTSREEWRKAKELEEARKAGTAPAAVDEEGKDINPHIPQYISTAPWYFGSAGPTLKHQRPQPEKQSDFHHLNEYYSRGNKGQFAFKYRKGACENCGGMGHKKKDCVERPRKVGAKFTGIITSSDDVVLPSLYLDYDGKRDRWNGYDPSEYKAVIEEHQKVEVFKRQIKAKKLKEGQDLTDDDDDDDDDEDDDEDEDKYAESVDMPGTKVDSKQRITVRNLRIREDTAKYLRNLDPNSAYYDPKTRSMRDNPYKNTGKGAEEVDYAGENFIRYTGDTVDQAKAQLFAWEAYDKGVDVSLQAEPTKLEMLKKQFDTKKDEFKNKVSDDLLEKYGGRQHLQVPPKALLLAQSENYVEYSRHGKIIKGVEKLVTRSKYEEDIYPNNHTSVWGSYWRSGVWGYKCCHSFVKNSYCTGESGKCSSTEMITSRSELSEAKEDGLNKEDREEEEPKTLMEMHKEKMKKKEKKKKERKRKRKESSSSSSSSSDSSDSGSDSESKKEERRKKLRLALIKAKREEEEAEEMLMLDERKRKYNSMYNAKAPTEEEIEAFYLRKQRADDPMAAFLDK
ncbi:pre-mRNA-splicing factor Slu7 [Oratosquilla oratoria]|uniref:pre-mRNA-splicing factor Slu7 n=1 Tax=Oratosquilla oratoria TaxID=337810 RepID=UPI003F7711FC